MISIILAWNMIRAAEGSLARISIDWIVKAWLTGDALPEGQFV
jgi:hypothetical protein